MIFTALSKTYVLVLFYGQPYKGWQAGLLTGQLAIVFYSSGFHDSPQFSGWLSCPPKKEYCYFSSPKRERLGHKSSENHWFSAREQLDFIALHRKLSGGFFCVRVNFTTDCVSWSSHKTKQRTPIFMVSRWLSYIPVSLLSKVSLRCNLPLNLFPPMQHTPQQASESLKYHHGVHHNCTCWKNI